MLGTINWEPDPMTIDRVGRDLRITLVRTETPGWLLRLFGRRPTTERITFVGNGTAWHRLPESTRAGTWLAGMLAETEALVKQIEEAPQP